MRFCNQTYVLLVITSVLQLPFGVNSEFTGIQRLSLLLHSTVNPQQLSWHRSSCVVTLGFQGLCFLTAGIGKGCVGIS